MFENATQGLWYLTLNEPLLEKLSTEIQISLGAKRILRLYVRENSSDVSFTFKDKFLPFVTPEKLNCDIS